MKNIYWSVGWLGLFCFLFLFLVGFFFSRTLIVEFQVDRKGFYPSVLSMEKSTFGKNKLKGFSRQIWPKSQTNMVFIYCNL